MATIDVSGTTRQYILTLPTGYDPHHAYPLLFAFHGGSYNAQWVVDGTAPQSGPYYGIQAVANNTAILVAPQALSGSWTNQGGRDVAYVDAMLSRFESQLCVDQSRIFATGFSMGAIMTIALGCNDSSKFRAIAAMSGEIMNGCPDTRSLPYWSSHGMSDPTINISLGQDGARHLRPTQPLLEHDGRQQPRGVRELPGVRSRVPRGLVSVRRRPPAPSVRRLGDLGVPLAVLSRCRCPEPRTSAGRCSRAVVRSARIDEMLTPALAYALFAATPRPPPLRLGWPSTPSSSACRSATTRPPTFAPGSRRR